MSHDASTTDVLDSLRDVTAPTIDDDIVAAGLVDDIAVENGTARIRLALGAPHAPTETAIADGVRSAVGSMGLDPELSAMVPRLEAGETEVLPTVTNVIPVASGKGGVGKSTVAVNLAAGLADRGARVGLFDADVYGPNVPRMLGIDAEPSVIETDDGKRIDPISEGGMEVMSLGLLVEDDDPVVWRGPMVNRTLTNLFDDVSWGSLDYLVVDLPPGTGDVPLTVLQNLPVTGSVVVTTPQSVATDDARKSLELFSEHRENVLGIVENMSTFVCPDCGSTHDVFGTGGGESLAAETDLPFLGRVPLDPAVREGGDEGTPVVRADTGAAADAFDQLAASVSDQVGILRRSHRRDAERGET